MRDKISRAEIRKDALQDGVTAASQAVGSLATILTTAVSDVARTLGGFATEIFEIRDATRKANRDHDHVAPGPADGQLGSSAAEPDPPAQPKDI